MKQEGYIPVDEFQALVKELYMSGMVADHDVPARHTIQHTNLQIEKSSSHHWQSFWLGVSITAG